MACGGYHHAIILSPCVYARTVYGENVANDTAYWKHEDAARHLATQLMSRYSNLAVLGFQTSNRVPSDVWSDADRLNACFFSQASRIIIFVPSDGEEQIKHFTRVCLTPLLTQSKETGGRPDWHSRFIVAAVGNVRTPSQLAPGFPFLTVIRFREIGWVRDVTAIMLLQRIIKDFWSPSKVKQNGNYSLNETIETSSRVGTNTYVTGQMENPFVEDVHLKNPVRPNSSIARRVRSRTRDSKSRSRSQSRHTSSSGYRSLEPCFEAQQTEEHMLDTRLINMVDIMEPEVIKELKLSNGTSEVEQYTFQREKYRASSDRDPYIPGSAGYKMNFSESRLRSLKEKSGYKELFRASTLTNGRLLQHGNHTENDQELDEDVSPSLIYTARSPSQELNGSQHQNMHLESPHTVDENHGHLSEIGSPPLLVVAKVTGVPGKSKIENRGNYSGSRPASSTGSNDSNACIVSAEPGRAMSYDPQRIMFQKLAEGHHPDLFSKSSVQVEESRCFITLGQDATCSLIQSVHQPIELHDAVEEHPKPIIHDLLRSTVWGVSQARAGQTCISSEIPFIDSGPILAEHEAFDQAFHPTVRSSSPNEAPYTEPLRRRPPQNDSTSNSTLANGARRFNSEVHLPSESVRGAYWGVTKTVKVPVVSKPSEKPMFLGPLKVNVGEERSETFESSEQASTITKDDWTNSPVSSGAKTADKTPPPKLATSGVVVQPSKPIICSSKSRDDLPDPVHPTLQEAPADLSVTNTSGSRPMSYTKKTITRREFFTTSTTVERIPKLQHHTDKSTEAVNEKNAGQPSTTPGPEQSGPPRQTQRIPVKIVPAQIQATDKFLPQPRDSWAKPTDAERKSNRIFYVRSTRPGETPVFVEDQVTKPESIVPSQSPSTVRKIPARQKTPPSSPHLLNRPVVRLYPTPWVYPPESTFADASTQMQSPLASGYMAGQGVCCYGFTGTRFQKDKLQLPHLFLCREVGVWTGPDAGETQRVELLYARPRADICPRHSASLVSPPVEHMALLTKLVEEEQVGSMTSEPSASRPAQDVATPMKHDETNLWRLSFIYMVSCLTFLLAMVVAYFCVRKDNPALSDTNAFRRWFTWIFTRLSSGEPDQD
ncbi:hypothetical protein PHET_00343 [Paragonimus heterotremus]|uniref:Uncharacterized protein n=1 Tax=Paragonimus heterotremus TaxID=100268 RepID=A0A8J4WM76_9TREM|nr:hypothetical protein PHET_00343 [Paragonimus heterotremus]